MTPLPPPGRKDRYIRRFSQLDQGLFRVGTRHAAASEYQGQIGTDNDTGGVTKLLLARG